MSVTQERKLVTEIPGPRSVELLGQGTALGRARDRDRAAGVRHRGRWRDRGGCRWQPVDRSRVRDRGGERRQRGAAVVAAVQEQVARFTHTCFMVTPYDGVSRGVRGAEPDHARRPREAVGAAELRRRGSRERGEDRPCAHQAGRGGGVRPRVSRPDQPDHGDDGEEHAVQGRVRAVRTGGLSGADVVPVSGRAERAGGGGPVGGLDREVRRRVERGVCGDRTDPRGGRLRRTR